HHAATEPGMQYRARESVRGLSRLSYRRQEAVWAYVMLAPTIIGLVLFILGPFLASLALAFVSTNFITGYKWVGLGNFAELFGNSTFWTSMGNTAEYVVGHVVPTVALGLGLALA